MKVETKYDIRQTVWVVAPIFCKGKFVETSISKAYVFRIILYKNDIVYDIAGRYYMEEDVFASEEEAIANQKRIKQKHIDIAEGRL